MGFYSILTQKVDLEQFSPPQGKSKEDTRQWSGPAKSVRASDRSKTVRK